MGESGEVLKFSALPLSFFNLYSVYNHNLCFSIHSYRWITRYEALHKQLSMHTYIELLCTNSQFPRTEKVPRWAENDHEFVRN